MGIAIVIIVVIAALLVIASGVWVAISLIAALATLKTQPLTMDDYLSRDAEEPPAQSDRESWS